MARPLLTSQEIREKHKIFEIEKQAQQAYDNNTKKLRRFLKTKKMGNSVLELYLGQCVYFLTLKKEERLDIEQRLRDNIKKRDKRWIKRLKRAIKILDDGDLFDYLLIPKEALKKPIGWLEDEIKWWSKTTHAGYNQGLCTSLKRVIVSLLAQGYSRPQIKEFIYDLFVEFNFEDYGKGIYIKHQKDRIRKEFIEPTLREPPLQGINIYGLSLKPGDEKSRNRWEIAKKFERKAREPVTIRIRPKLYGK